MARKAKASIGDLGNRSELIDALSFATVADTSKDIDKFSFVSIRNGMVSGANDVFSVGKPAPVELELCLHGAKLKAALEHCGANFQLTQLDTASVSVKSDKYRATIPCIDIDMLPAYTPDPVCAVISDTVKDGFSLLHPLISERTDRAIDHGLHLRPYSSVAINGGILFEHWHEHDLPPGLIIPKATVIVVSKIKAKLTGFGFSPNSVTFWFGDNSYLRTKLIDGKYPDTDKLFPAGANLDPMPAEFFTALDAIDKFIENDAIYFSKGHMATHPNLTVGACYKLDGIPNGGCYSAQYFKRLRDLATSIAWPAELSKPICFHGGAKVRGLLMGKNG